MYVCIVLVRVLYVVCVCVYLSLLLPFYCHCGTQCHACQDFGRSIARAASVYLGPMLIVLIFVLGQNLRIVLICSYPIYMFY